MSGFFGRSTNYVNVIHVLILMICLCDEVNGSKANLATSHPWHLNFIVCLQLVLFFYNFQIFAIVSVFFIILSIASFCLETHSKFRYDISSNSSGEPRTIVEQVRNTRPHVLFQVLEYMCMVFFTFEVTVRFISCPNKSKFIKDFYNWIELFSVIPFYSLIIANCISPAFITTDIGIFINAMRFIRIFRILKLTRYFSSLKVIGHTIRASAKELLLLFLVLIIGVLIFGVLIYFAEQIQEDTQNDFSDIPISFYWAVETMTTLGYGDIVPRTMSGYIIGCACAVCGLLMLSLPVPIIVSNFTLYYTHAQAKMKLPKKNKNILVGAANALKESSFGTVTPVDSNGSAGGECSKESRRNSNDSALGSCNSTGNFIYSSHLYPLVLLAEYCMFVKNRGYSNIPHSCDFSTYVLITCLCN